MKRLLLLICASAALLGAVTTTTVSQTVLGPDGTPGNGVAYITISAACSGTGFAVAKHTLAVPFVNGSFVTTLVSNDACLDSLGQQTTYTVSWTVCRATSNASLNRPCAVQGPAWAETWRVPTSSSPVSVYGAGGVLVVNPATINVAALTDGTYCMNITNGTVLSLSKCAGGGGGVTYTSMHGVPWSDVNGVPWSQLNGVPW